MLDDEFDGWYEEYYDGDRLHGTSKEMWLPDGQSATVSVIGNIEDDRTPWCWMLTCSSQNL